MTVSQRKLINKDSVYIGHNIYCTVLVGHVLDTVESAILWN